mmetsp:Transcript_6694/g.9365  ORF Transcript_6694/g.9365 Transcript_6694/m.9365 type:complete len:580 (+) Transcript_6694:50-1789(+)
MESLKKMISSSSEDIPTARTSSVQGDENAVAVASLIDEEGNSIRPGDKDVVKLAEEGDEETGNYQEEDDNYQEDEGGDEEKKEGEEDMIVSTNDDDDIESSHDTVPDDAMKRAKESAAVQHPSIPQKNPCLCPDVIFALGYGLSFLGTLSVAFTYGWTDMSEANYDDDDKADATANLAKVLFSQLLFAAALANIFQFIAIRIGHLAIHCSLISTEVVLVLSGAFAAHYLDWYLCLILLIVAVIMIIFHANSCYSIELASTTFEVATKFLRVEHFLEFLAFVGSIVSTVAIFTTVYAIYALWHYKSTRKNENRSSYSLSMFLLICVFYWTAQLMKYITCSVTGGVAKFWWSQEIPPIGKAAPNSLFRAWLFNFGSLSFGSLLVDFFDSIMSAFQMIIRFGERFPNDKCASCLVASCVCCLGGCQNGCDTFNPYAFIYIGQHGYSFLYAGKTAAALFQKQGHHAYDTENLSDYVFFWCALGIGLASSMLGLWMVNHGDSEYSRGTNNAQAVVGFVGFFGGTAVANQVFGLLRGANKSMVLLFCEQPRVLALTFPDYFGTLATVWKYGTSAIGGPTYGSHED